MVTRTLKIIGALLIVVVGFAGTADAYPPGGTVVKTDKSTYTVGSSVLITASGFQACAGQLVTFTITPPGGGAPIILTAIANADGTATVPLTAPATLGVYAVVATSPGCPDASTSFTVSRLPQTGGNTQSWVVTGVALVLTGLGFWFVARRRRHPAAAE
ncbi:MAG: LPXTG cell wall anchor domain-containing protein [Ilumatobacteraceae bacterium]|nr:LPXTG cell wall anchor domain-containing protein [Ilumatobacteraceae bacterium]